MFRKISEVLIMILLSVVMLGLAISPFVGIVFAVPIGTFVGCLMVGFAVCIPLIAIIA